MLHGKPPKFYKNPQDSIIENPASIESLDSLLECWWRAGRCRLPRSAATRSSIVLLHTLDYPQLIIDFDSALCQVNNKSVVRIRIRGFFNSRIRYFSDQTTYSLKKYQIFPQNTEVFRKYPLFRCY